MRVAFSLRHWRRLFMQHDPSELASSVAGPPLKRSFAQQATATAFQETPLPTEDDRLYSSSPSSFWEKRPGKVPKVKSDQSPSRIQSRESNIVSAAFEMPSTHRKGSTVSRISGTRSEQGWSSKQYAGRKDRPRGAHSTCPELEGPLHDAVYIEKQHRMNIGSRPELKPALVDNPKSPLNNYTIANFDCPPKFESNIYYTSSTKQRVFRCTSTLDTEPQIVAIGDHTDKKVAERLCALSALYQLYDTGLLDKPKRPKATIPEGPPQIELSDGSVVNYERARSFMDYYCRIFGFGKPDVQLTEQPQRAGLSSWEAVMRVDGRRIGMGTANNKKNAQIQCYLDVTKYLQSCDPDLWNKYIQAAKTGKDLGLASKVYLPISSGLSFAMEKLCGDIEKSTLYQKSRTRSTSSDSSRASIAPAAPLPSRRYFPPFAAQEKSETLQKRREAYLKDPMMETMRTARAALPVYSRSDMLLSHIRENEVTICMATTGSGKTTQIPQLILDDYIDRGQGAHCNIICTQPRRLAAVSVADRVAKERGERLGMSIGYSVRFESKPPEEHGSITFCTVGVLLKRLQNAMTDGGLAANKLDQVTHIVVDEVHERDVDTDLLLMVLKRLMQHRRARNLTLKVVLMSATIDARLFQEYFADESGSKAQVIDIPGRTYPVAKHFMEDFIDDMKQMPRLNSVFREESVTSYIAREEAYVQSNNATIIPTSSDTQRLKDEELELPGPLVAGIICYVLERSTSGHVLVFLPGWEEISAVQRFLTTASLPLDFNDHTQYSLHILHSTIPLADQQAIFEPPPRGVRRVILATNIAETSVTIPDVVYVVDAAKVKELRYDPDRHMTSLVSAWVGSSNLNQRAGRAGRHRPGEYYGLLSRVRAANLNPHQTVEMKRVDLSNIVMHVKALNFPGMGVEDVLAATIEPPAPGRIAAAMKNLQMVEALDHQKNLTPLGRVLLQIPVDVQIGRLLLYGSVFRCLDKALSLASILTCRDPFVCPLHLKEEASAKKVRWSPKEFRSDALTILDAYSAWLELYNKGEHLRANKFCIENFLSKPTLLLITKLRAHLLQSLYSAAVIDATEGGLSMGRGREITVPSTLNQNGDSQPMLAALIALALQPKYAVRTGERTLRTQHDKTTFIHPSSVNHRKHVAPGDDQGERQLYAYAEKRQNLSMAGQSPQTYLLNTTRLDPMTYLLFGAYDIQLTGRGLECDEWLPVVGNLDVLDDILRLKTMLESCMSRVFGAIHMSQQQKGQRRMGIPAQEDESGEERSLDQDISLSPRETMDLESITRDTVRLLNRYSDERMAMQSQPSSLSVTPTASPVFSTSRLTRSGYSTPYGVSSTYGSRPGTPSRLSRGFYP